MKWLKMHAQYDDAHPWEALEIVCTLAGTNPSRILQVDIRKAICKSYDYMFLFLEHCMEIERETTPAGVNAQSSNQLTHA
jgi:pyrroloquinoline quinone (PQQ) biosynthesis protein C